MSEKDGSGRYPEDKSCDPPAGLPHESNTGGRPDFGLAGKTSLVREVRRAGRLAALLAAGVLAISGCRRSRVSESSESDVCFRLFEDDRSSEAIACYDEVLGKKPNDSKALSRKGSALLTLPGNTQEALQCFEKALDINPDDDDALNGIGAVHGMRGDMETAKAFFKKALDKNDKNPEAWNNLGIAYGREGEHEKALECFEKALAIKPNDPRYLRNRDAARGNLGISE